MSVTVVHSRLQGYKSLHLRLTLVMVFQLQPSTTKSQYLLMKFLDSASLDLVSFADWPPSEYAILSSSTWEQPLGRLARPLHTPSIASGKDLTDLRLFADVLQACKQARDHNIRYLWAKGLCVDESSPADISEFVNSSFHLVWNATLLIVHLRDLALPSDTTPSALEKALSRCTWFAHSWTLQELVASRRIQFHDRDWNICGAKNVQSLGSWFGMLSRISGVDLAVIKNRNELFQVSIGRRLSWAIRRRTRRPEDIAYSLLGICGVGGGLTPRYGEGRRTAFFRLQEKILMKTTDLSILAWKRQHVPDDREEGVKAQQSSWSGFFADSVDDFSHFASDKNLSAPFASDCELTFSNRGLIVQGPLAGERGRPGLGSEVVLVLHTQTQAEPVHIGIRLREIKPGISVRCNPYEIVYLPPQRDNLLMRYVRICRTTEPSQAQLVPEERTEWSVSAWMDGVMECEQPPTASLQHCETSLIMNRV